MLASDTAGMNFIVFPRLKLYIYTVCAGRPVEIKG